MEVLLRGQITTPVRKPVEVASKKELGVVLTLNPSLEEVAAQGVRKKQEHVIQMHAQVRNQK